MRRLLSAAFGSIVAPANPSQVHPATPGHLPNTTAETTGERSSYRGARRIGGDHQRTCARVCNGPALTQRATVTEGHK